MDTFAWRRYLWPRPSDLLWIGHDLDCLHGASARAKGQITPLDCTRGTTSLLGEPVQSFQEACSSALMGTNALLLITSICILCSCCDVSSVMPRVILCLIRSYGSTRLLLTRLAQAAVRHLQLVRGAAPTKLVASRMALRSLLSVDMSSLSDSEKSTSPASDPAPPQR